MPELPEVETIRIGLETYLVGHKIQNVKVLLSRIISGDPKKIINGKVTGVRRYGKGLLIDLDNGYSIAIHVKMTGQLLYQNKFKNPKTSKDKKVKVSELPDKYTHIIFKLNKEAVLFYRDVRQFGWIKFLPAKEATELYFFKSLGPEPLKDLTFEKFKLIISSSRINIKVLLMDQKKISGIGNIYANDALYVAGIDPRRIANTLIEKEQMKLFEAIEKVLKRGLKSGGASEWSYVNVFGGSGKYQNYFEVYNQKGKSCKTCGFIIKKIILGGRGTYYCPQCQS